MGVANILADRVLVTTQTTGTGTYSLGNAVSDGFFAPSEVTPSLNGARVSYAVVDSLTAPTAVELGEGVLASGSPWTLTRATIRRSKQGGMAAAAAINWAVGTRYVYITPLAANTPQLDTDGWLALPSRLSVAGAATLTGGLTINQPWPSIALTKPAAGTGSAQIVGMTDSLARWTISPGDGSAELGGNSGSDFVVSRFTDAGAYMDVTLAISRATGIATFLRRPTHAGVQLAAQPQSAGGVGQWVALQSNDGAGVSLPAGGTWAYVTFRLITSTGSIVNGGGQVGIAAGGSNVGVTVSGHQYTGFAWRIA